MSVVRTGLATRDSVTESNSREISVSCETLITHLVSQPRFTASNAAPEGSFFATSQQQPRAPHPTGRAATAERFQRVRRVGAAHEGSLAPLDAPVTSPTSQEGTIAEAAGATTAGQGSFGKQAGTLPAHAPV